MNKEHEQKRSKGGLFSFKKSYKIDQLRYGNIRQIPTKSDRKFYSSFDPSGMQEILKNGTLFAADD